MTTRSLLLLLGLHVCLGATEGEAQVSKVASAASTTAVRGVVLTDSKYLDRAVPLAGVKVSVYAAPAAQLPVAETYTDPQGFFYLHLPPGTYVLRVAGGRDYQLQVLALDTRRFQFQDVPPIRI